MSNLFDFEEHPFKGRKVFISGYDSPMRKRLSAYISAAGGEKASVISKNVHFIISDGTNEQHKALRGKLLKNGYSIRTLTAEELFSITPDMYAQYKTEAEPVKTWRITPEVVEERLLEKSKLNPYAGLDIYVSEKEAGAEIRQMFGYLGAFANIDIEGSVNTPSNAADGTLVCFLGARALSDIENGRENDVVAGIENYYNKSKSVTLNIWFIREPDFISFARRWAAMHEDIRTKEMLQIYDAARY